eukprot:jgi/Mesvir1/22110/Mv18713-RA.1
MERALRLVDFYTRHLSACDEIVLERVSIDEDEVAECCVGKNVVIAGQIIRKQKFPEGDWKDVLEVCVEAADEAIEKIALKSMSATSRHASSSDMATDWSSEDDRARVDELLRALDEPLYRSLTDEETRLARLFHEFLETDRVVKGPEHTAKTARVFEAFSDFMEDKGGTVMSDLDLSDFAVFKGRTRLGMVAGALMKYAGDGVKDELTNEIIDRLDRTGVENLGTEEKYKTCHLHALFLVMAQKKARVPREVKRWMLEHRRRLSDKVWDMNPNFKRGRMDFFHERARWPPWDSLRTFEDEDAPDRPDPAVPERASEAAPAAVPTLENAEAFLASPLVVLCKDGYTKVKDFRKAYLGQFLGDPLWHAGKGRTTVEDLRAIFEPSGIEFVSDKKIKGVKADWVKGVRLADNPRAL